MRDPSEFFRVMKSAVFVNPIAGAGRAERNFRKVQRAFEREGVAPDFVIATSTVEMEARVRAAIADGVVLIFAMGGDGTVQAVVNAVGAGRVDDRDVVIGILPSGGGNDFASALGMPTDVAEAVAVFREGTMQAVDVLRARTGDGRTRLFVGGGGVGLDVDAVMLASTRYRKWPGRSRYLASALRAWREFQPLGVRAEFPDDDLPAIEGRVMLAAVLNTPSYGAGMRIAPGASVDDGLFDVSILQSLNATQIGRAIPRLFASGKLPDSYFIRNKARTVILQTDRSCMFQGDGEILGPAPARIEVVPKAIRVLAPAWGEVGLETKSVTC
ncbi:MAG: diacylglycerol kinase family lipid kinase [Acidobacteria bacterium]|nr:diacylglycerol kinase family lipid kinase [Acidobacteriota bacterium]